MTVDWTHGVPDLLVALDREAGRLGLQIQDQLRAAIRDRRLGAGERLPSTRRLAELLGVSRGTVVDVYEQLLAEGYVESVVGSGTRVAVMPVSGPARSDPGAAPASHLSSQPAVADFEYGIPDLGSVPLTAWSWAVSEATRTLPTAELGDEDSAGSKHLREVVTAYHRRVRAGCAVAEDAIVVSGFRQGLAFRPRDAGTARHRAHRAGGSRSPRARRHRPPRRPGRGAGSCRRPRPRRGSPARDRSTSGAVDPGPPMPHRCGARPVAATRPGCLGRRGRRGDPRGRLRRRFPVRPSAGRLASGPQPDPRDRTGIGQQDARAGDPAGLGARAAHGSWRESSRRSGSAVAALPAWTRKRWRCSWRRAASTVTCDACGRSTAHAGTCWRPRSNSPSGRVGCRGWRPAVTPCCASPTGHPSAPSWRPRRPWA